jgi:beta-lactamase regulating signal transducer with metallopeptidase domain
MNLSHALTSPGFMVLFKWTTLLMVGWLAHWILRNRHARSRLFLWRSILCLGLILPWSQFIQIPGLRIPITTEDNSSPELFVAASPVSVVLPSEPVKVTSTASPAGAARNVTAVIPSSRKQSSTSKAGEWPVILMGIWALGFMYGVIRLLRLQRQLSLLRNTAAEPALDLRTLVEHAKLRLSINAAIEIKVSDTVTTPFVCGLLKPALMLPKGLVQQLSHKEISALLNHELAHLRQHDLIWCVGWRWIKAICWFHPLVWPVPAAHNLACEQEADRIAAGQLEDKDSYGTLLARLALHVLELPAVETKLTLNGGSQIIRRLNHLRQKDAAPWNWKHSAAGSCLVGMLFLMTAGCNFTNSNEIGSKVPVSVEFKKVVVVIQDADGKPIEGATILPTGFRVKGMHGADAYGWNKKLFGEPEKAVTDREGKAYIKYPIEGIPEEKEYTGKLILKVSHPEFASQHIQSYSVDSEESPIHLTRGIHLTVSGFFGSDQQPVTELIANINEELPPDEWIKGSNYTLSFHKMSPGGHLIQLMGRLPDGKVVYSESLAFEAEAGQEYNFALEMKPGIRLEGRLDDRVPRPVKNGRVLISVRPKQIPAWNNYHDVDDLLKKYPNFYPWKSYRLIAEDGTFVFEAVPPGGLDVIAHGDGFVSKSGGDFSQWDGSKLTRVPGFALPQAFSLVAPTTEIEVLTELPATMELTAKTKSGKPVEGAAVYLNPNVVRMNGIFGDLKKSSEEPFRTMSPLPDVKYSATTDKNGVAVIDNIPATARGMEVYHPQYQVPLQEPNGWRDRHIRMTFSPGITNRFELQLEPKGKDFIGGN